MATPETISSAANPLVKRIRQLSDRRHRRREGAFVVDGVQPVWRAVEAGWDIETLVVTPGLLPATAATMVEERRAAGVRVVEVPEHLAARLTERDRPAGLLAIVRCRDIGIDELVVGPGAVFVALHEVGNPGNLGTVVRTADAVGAAGIILVSDTTDQYAPASVKASMGSLFAVPVARAASADVLFRWARAAGVRVLATSGYAEHSHWAGDLGGPAPLAILLGSEGEGLPEDLLARADAVARIPMVGTAESLNLAVAAALMLYEARRPALE